MKHANLSDIGNVRQNNEDYAWSGINKYNNMAGIVCDGLGGYKGGSAASEITVSTFIEKFENTDFNIYTGDQIVEWIDNIIESTRNKIANHIQDNEKLENMATTFVCSIVVGSKVYIFNVGDSRAWYITREHKGHQVSEDQNLLNYLNKMSAPKELYRLHRENLFAITQFIGTKNKRIVKPDVFIEQAAKGDYVVLTSDGCHNFIDIHQMVDAISFDHDNLDNACNAIISKALVNYSNDNLSIVILEI